MPRMRVPSNDGTENNDTNEKNDKDGDAQDRFLIVGIGASAGGLDVFRKFFDVMPADSGMAFVLVQHLDPSHDSLVAELLSGHTKMKVCQAVEGMPVAPDCVYVIPPGASLAIINNSFHLSPSEKGHGARFPFDFLLQSLAEQVRERAVGIVLSGNGTDGSIGLKSIHNRGGFIISQEPAEASFDGMPQSAIETGLVDRVLPVAKIPNALIAYSRWLSQNGILRPDEKAAASDHHDEMTRIIELLRANSMYDFTLYKRGTLERRVSRRMAMSGIHHDNLNLYLEMLEDNPDEIGALAKDLLINVTNFFRDPDTFELLADKIVPAMIEKAVPGVPLRIWSIGCSSGEEAYSIVMIFLEQIAALKRPISIQVFASDIDPDAIDTARQGLYPHTIAADVSPERLARFFTVDEAGYRVSQRLRDSVIFTVQDVLTDPPFSRIDMVSCRNLLIYLLADAQAKVFSLIQFALTDHGVLLLGASEALGKSEDWFETVFKQERIYRRIPGQTKRFYDVTSITNRELRSEPFKDVSHILPRQTFLANLSRRLVLEAFAPASVLVNAERQCVFTLGDTSHYLRVVPGHPTDDIMAMTHDDVRGHLRTAISQAEKTSERIEVEGGRIKRDGKTFSFNISVQPVRDDGGNLLLICFVETPETATDQPGDGSQKDSSRVMDLEKELAAKKIELATALYNIEIFAEAQTTVNAEALSVNEEFQATNEELLTSKEELQSLNEELSTLNAQLQETLERHQRTSNDLQNVLYSADVATIFLDTDLNIRFFTPAARAVFNIIEGDIGRPLSDLSPLSGDQELLGNSKSVLTDEMPREQEIQAIEGKWFNRRILPYRTSDSQVDGVVISYHDITQQKHAAKSLETARHLAEMSNAKKSEFLAAASHDLRQPLQTLLLLHGLLEPIVTDDKAKKLVARIGMTLASMSSMLDVLLDINRIDAGVIKVGKAEFEIGDLLKRLGYEFTYHAEAKNLEFRVVACRSHIVSDPALLEQMLRNLLANALKFTKDGKILLGCRRNGTKLRIQIWDTGVGIDNREIDTIFNEYHQLDAADGDADHRGLGLGLAIVKRMVNLLGHRIDVASHVNKGTVFSLEVDLAEGGDDRDAVVPAASSLVPEGALPAASYNILLIEDEPDILELFERSFRDAGHMVRTARNSASATRMLAAATAPPDIIIADYNLTDRTNGLRLALTFREKFGHDIPIIILTGDIATNTLRRIAQEGCMHIHKPVAPRDLEQAIRRLVNGAMRWQKSDKPLLSEDTAVISVIDDDSLLLEKLRSILEAKLSEIVNVYPSCEAFLEDYEPGGKQCLILDAYLPGMNGIKLLHQLRKSGDNLPTIVITGLSDTQIAVDAMKAGALNFIEKPVNMDELYDSVSLGLDQAGDMALRNLYLEDFGKRYSTLTARQVEVMDLVLLGHPSKNIAADLGISQRTVENHRATIMTKTGSKSLPALARFAGAVAEINRE
jgi:two-component system CheB/CheR fusion protein